VQTEAIVSSWGTSLGIRIPKEFTDILGISRKSKVQLEMKNGVLQVTPIRMRKPLAEILAEAKKDGTWDGMPPEATAEDRGWLDMPSIGAEVVEYEKA